MELYLQHYKALWNYQDDVTILEYDLSNCSEWYDGCNECHVEKGRIVYCTEKACLTEGTPKCLESLNKSKEAFDNAF